MRTRPHAALDLRTPTRVRRVLGAAMLLVALGALGMATTDEEEGDRQGRATTGDAASGVPASRGGGDLVGQPFPPDLLTRWTSRRPTPPSATAPADSRRITLYRWWTTGCPYCARSLPALEAIRKRVAPMGVDVVAVFHPKPPRAVNAGDVERDAARLGFLGPVAIDEQWAALKALYLSTGRRSATSASFLVDETGTIRFVHPGPEVFPPAQRVDAVPNQDHADLVAAIDALVQASAARQRAADGPQSTEADGTGEAPSET